MGPQIVVSAHAPLEITKPHKLGLRYAVLEARVRGIKVSLSIFCEWL